MSQVANFSQEDDVVNLLEASESKMLMVVLLSLLKWPCNLAHKKSKCQIVPILRFDRFPNNRYFLILQNHGCGTNLVVVGIVN
jgi:hypothetical protein